MTKCLVRTLKELLDLKTSLEDMRDGFKLDIADIDLAEEWGLNGWLENVKRAKIEISLAPPGGPGAWGSVGSPGVSSPVMSDAWKAENRGLYTNFGTSLWEACLLYTSDAADE